jgi:hypothetical protein
MDLTEALKKARLIIEEEQVEPTIEYRYGTDPTLAIAYQFILASERVQRPRKVYEDPKQYVFRSTNFDLLVKIFNQVAEKDRPNFVSSLLDLVRTPMASHAYNSDRFPSFQYKTSGLALLAEFCVRTGNLKELVAATTEPKMPTASLAIMMREIEEMIALNFNLLSNNELESLPSGLAPLREIAYRQTWSARGQRNLPGRRENNPHFKMGFAEVGKEIVAAIDGIAQECRKAIYWYLKGALQELPNLEVESDKVKVEGFLVKLGFSGDMVKSLNAAESDYKSTATPFELKNCLSHLRSFLEHLHRESVRAIASSIGDPVVDKWSDATAYLRKQGYFTIPQEKFVASLYGLLSDESVHPLTADREYARLLRNVVIEYGVMFLTMLDKRGITI